MDISNFTGSREPLDNWTSLYTFALGIIAGSFLAVGIGEVRMAEGLRGDLLRIYLAVLTAVLAFIGALSVSRLGDRISDQRSTWRRTFAAKRRINTLIAALTNLYEIFDNDRETPLKIRQVALEVFLKRLSTAADEAIDYFRRYARYTAPLASEGSPQRDFLLHAGLSHPSLSNHRAAVSDLSRVLAHFEERVSRR